MKNYSSSRAGRGKTAYRAPSSWRYRQKQKIDKSKNINIKKETVNFYDKK